MASEKQSVERKVVKHVKTNRFAQWRVTFFVSIFSFGCTTIAVGQSARRTLIFTFSFFQFFFLIRGKFSPKELPLTSRELVLKINYCVKRRALPKNSARDDGVSLNILRTRHFWIRIWFETPAD